MDPALTPLLAPVAGLTQPVLAPLAHTVNPIVTPLVEPVAELAQQVASPINQALDPILTPLLTPVTQLVGAVVAPLAQAAVDTLQPVLVPLLQPITEAAAAAADQSLAPRADGSLAGAMSGPDAFSGQRGPGGPPAAPGATLGSPLRAPGGTIASSGSLAAVGLAASVDSPSSSGPSAPRPASPDPSGRGSGGGSIRNAAPQPLSLGLLIATIALFLLGVARPDTLRSLRPTPLPYLVIQPG